MMWSQYAGMMGNWVLPGFWALLFPLMILDLVLKGIALWRSAQAREKWWFIALFLINSLGILPAIYLLTHRVKSKEK